MAERWVLQFCHCHYGPFLDVARQYAVLFQGRPYKVLTVYLTGEDTPEARSGSASDEVMFLNFRSKDVGGLKLAAIRSLKQILATRDFALIIAHRFKPLYIACLASKTLPVIGVHHAFGDYKRAPRRWFVNTFRKRLSLLAVSDAVRDDIRQNLPLWPKERIETLHNRLDVVTARTGIVPRDVARAALGLPQDSVVIGNVGRLHTDKDQTTLIKGFAAALPRLPHGTLLAIAGSGPLLDQLQALVENLGVSGSVLFLGQVKDIRRLFSAFDLFVLSSDHEPFGMVLLEAMVAGVPVIASACGGAPEVVGDPARLFPLRDAATLADKLESFLSSPPNTSDDLDRLRCHFSDQAARARFFSLTLVVHALNREHFDG